MSFLKGLKRGTKDFGETIAIVVNSILLSIAYILGLGITAIFAKIKRKSFLDLKKENKDSYWSDLNIKKQSFKDCYTQS